MIIGTRNEAPIPVLFTAKHKKKRALYEKIKKDAQHAAENPDLSEFEGRYAIYSFKSKDDYSYYEFKML